MAKELRMGLTPDASLFKLATPDAHLELDAHELGGLIQALSVFRIRMRPPLLAGDPRPTTVMNGTTASTWYVSVDPARPEFVRLCLFQPGFGWIWIPLNDEQGMQLTQGLADAFANRPGGPTGAPPLEE